MTWTVFHDMRSGGSQKTEWENIYIEAESEEDAIERFRHTLGRDPFNVTCECCGDDYAVSTNGSLAQLTGYARGCDFIDNAYVEKERTNGFLKVDYITLDEYLKRPDVLAINSRFIRLDGEE